MIYQTIRQIVFETNSSSIHALSVSKNAECKDFKDIELTIKPFEQRELDDTMEFKSLEKKLRYLWTIRCLYDKWGGYEDFVDEFTSMLRAIFPKCSFIEVDYEVPYMEDFDYLHEDLLMLSENFINRLINCGRIIFTTRDGNYNDFNYDLFMDKLRSLRYESKKSDATFDLVWSEG